MKLSGVLRYHTPTRLTIKQDVEQPFMGVREEIKKGKFARSRGLFVERKGRVRDISFRYTLRKNAAYVGLSPLIHILDTENTSDSCTF